MANFVTGFIPDDIVAVHRYFQRVIVHSRQTGPQSAATTRLLEAAYRTFQLELNELARVSALDAQKKMRERLRKTAKRPDTGVTPHLRTSLTARPLRGTGPFATGAVGVADKAHLEKARSPVDDFAYWKVQEEGTRANVGRAIRGYFFDKGFVNATRPAPGFTGTPAAQPLFRSGRLGNFPASVSGGIGPRGGKGGKGVIKNPIRARHFIRDGAQAAHANWLAGLRLVESSTLANIRAALGGGRVVRRAPTRLRGRPVRRRGL